MCRLSRLAGKYIYCIYKHFLKTNDTLDTRMVFIQFVCNLKLSTFARIHQRPIYAFAINHYNDVIMATMASQITSLMIVYSTVYTGVDQRKHQSSASLAFVRRIHRGQVNSPHKEPVTPKMFPFYDVIMNIIILIIIIIIIIIAMYLQNDISFILQVSSRISSLINSTSIAIGEYYARDIKKIFLI